MNTSIPNKHYFSKAIILGESGVGKTSLLNNFGSLNNDKIRNADSSLSKSLSSMIKPTIGADFHNKVIALDNGDVIEM
jgi:GTPase SAR1 family protein